MQSPTIKPANFRVNRFILGGKEVLIAGMARPNYSDELSVNSRLKYLHDDAKRTVLIGLYGAKDFSVQATAQGLEYHFIPVHDLPGTGHPIDPERYDKIYEVVKKATNEGKLVTIHCGAGDGRTGTALASLKLRELLELQASVNASTLDDAPQKTAVVRVSFNGVKDVPCTPFVKQAVEAVRQQRIVSSNSDLSGSHSVETENDIDTLLNYEIHLRQKIKQELKAQAGSPVVQAPIALPLSDVKQQRAADSVSANVPLSGFMPKQATYWDLFVGLVNALIASIKQLFVSVFGKSAASYTPPPGAGGVGVSASGNGFFSSSNQPAASGKQSTKDLVI